MGRLMKRSAETCYTAWVEEALPSRLVLYDGVCGLCDKSVQWLLDHDPEGRLVYAPLEGPSAKAALEPHTLPAGLDSIVYVERDDAGAEKVYWRSRAILRIVAQLPGGWRRLAWLRVLPAFLTDLGYRLVAAVRYRIWGKLDVCRVPSPEQRARFLP